MYLIVYTLNRETKRFFLESNTNTPVNNFISPCKKMGVRDFEIMKPDKELCEKIEYLKRRLIQTSDKNGMNHPLTIQISQELDMLINMYMKLTHEK